MAFLLFTLSILCLGYVVLAIDPPYGQLSVKPGGGPGCILGSDGKPVALHGMSLFWSQWMGKFYTPGVVDAIKCQWNGNIVRAAMGVDKGGYISDPETQKKLLETVVDAAIEKGMYVIIDWHIEGDTTPYKDKEQAFMDEMSKKYGKNPNIIYEIWNEPTEQSWSGQIKPYAEDIIKTIRKNDPKNLIIVGTPKWSQEVDQAAADPIKDDKNVAYTLHYYAASHKVSDLGQKAESALQKGACLFVTEYGTVQSSGDGSPDAASSKEWWQMLDKNKISYVNWAMDDKSEGASAIKPGTDPAQVGSESVTTDSGKLVKDQMKSQDNGVKCGGGDGGDGGDGGAGGAGGSSTPAPPTSPAQ